MREAKAQATLRSNSKTRASLGSSTLRPTSALSNSTLTSPTRRPTTASASSHTQHITSVPIPDPHTHPPIFPSSRSLALNTTTSLTAAFHQLTITPVPPSTCTSVACRNEMNHARDIIDQHVEQNKLLKKELREMRREMALLRKQLTLYRVEGVLVEKEPWQIAEEQRKKEAFAEERRQLRIQRRNEREVIRAAGLHEALTYTDSDFSSDTASSEDEMEKKRRIQQKLDQAALVRQQSAPRTPLRENILTKSNSKSSLFDRRPSSSSNSTAIESKEEELARIDKWNEDRLKSSQEKTIWKTKSTASPTATSTGARKAISLTDSENEDEYDRLGRGVLRPFGGADAKPLSSSLGEAARRASASLKEDEQDSEDEHKMPLSVTSDFAVVHS